MKNFDYFCILFGFYCFSSAALSRSISSQPIPSQSIKRSLPSNPTLSPNLTSPNRSIVVSQAVIQPAISSASTISPIPPIYQTRSEVPATERVGVNLDLSLGAAFFQDLQPPMDPFTEIRLDGTSNSPDSTSHGGVSIAASLGYLYPAELADILSSARIQRASSSTPIGTAAASYVRYSLDTGANWHLGSNVKLLTASELRRSTFRNTDNGHYVDALLFRLGMSHSISSFKTQASAAYAPISKFGFVQDSSRGRSGAIEGSKSSLVDVSGLISYLPDPSVEFYFKGSEEIVTADIENINVYKNFGFKVYDDAEMTDSKRVRLTTISIELGAIRKF